METLVQETAHAQLRAPPHVFLNVAQLDARANTSRTFGHNTLQISKLVAPGAA